MRCDGGINALGVELKPVKLVGRQRGDGAIGGGAHLENALGTVVNNKAWAEDLGEFTGSVTAEDVHLPKAVLRGDEALGDDEVVERSGMDVRYAVRIALDGDGRGEASNGESAVNLWQGIAHCILGPEMSGNQDCGDQDEKKGDKNGDRSEKNASATLGEAATFWLVLVFAGAAGEQGWLGWVWIVGVHALIASLNAAFGSGCLR